MHAVCNFGIHAIAGAPFASQFDLSVFAALGRADFDQTHAAHADGLQFRMIAKDGNLDADCFRGFDDERAVGDFN